MNYAVGTSFGDFCQERKNADAIRGVSISGLLDQEGHRVGCCLVNGPLVPNVSKQLPERRVFILQIRRGRSQRPQ